MVNNGYTLIGRTGDGRYIYTKGCRTIYLINPLLDPSILDKKQKTRKFKDVDSLKVYPLKRGNYAITFMRNNRKYYNTANTPELCREWARRVIAELESSGGF